VEHFSRHSKKDDLADSFLQGLWYINQKWLLSFVSAFKQSIFLWAFYLVSKRYF
jgi:hypothetical protein